MSHSESVTPTINEALTWMKTLKARHKELVDLRNDNAASTTRRWGVGGDTKETKQPVYDVKELDKMVTKLAREIRLLDQAIKNANAVARLVNYQINEDVLGELL